MTQHFQREIENLKRKLLQLSGLVEESMQHSVTAVIDRNTSLADDVIKNDHRIDDLEVELEEDCLKVLALHQPVAVDLRFVVAVLKINNDLERIGDLSVNIAKRSKELAKYPNTPVPFDLTGTLQLSLSMIKQAADALVNEDTVKAREIGATDDEVDRRHKETFKIVQEQIKQDPERTEYYVSLLSVSRHLERIADHATNIAEDVIYMVDGEIVRHQGIV